MTSFYVTPLLHPSTVRQGQHHREPPQQAYLDRLVRCVREGTSPSPWDVKQAPPGSYLYPSVRQLDLWYQEFNDEGYDAISHDLETAGQFIICDGLTPLDTRTGRVGRSLCLRFRGHLGRRWFSTRKDHDLAVAWLGKVLARPDVAFVGHNVVGFDIRILLDHGFVIPGRIIDTMVMMNRAHPEIQKSLGFTATLVLGAPAWKRDIKEQDEADSKG